MSRKNGQNEPEVETPKYTATVIKVYTRNYAEVAIWENGKPGPERRIAENMFEARREDVVEVEPAEPKTGGSWKPYLMVPGLYLLGLIAQPGASLQTRLINGMILGFMGFVAAWLLTRRYRMQRLMSCRVTRIVKESEHLWARRKDLDERAQYKAEKKAEKAARKKAAK